MEFIEFQDRIHKLDLLLQDPQPGLISWTMLVAQSMDELVARWNGDDK